VRPATTPAFRASRCASRCGNGAGRYGGCFEYLDARGVEIPLRTDCAWCFFQTLGEWYNLWREYLEIYLEAEAIEAAMGYTFRSPGRDSWPAPLAELRVRFEHGDIPRGADVQQDLFARQKCRVCRA